MLNGGAHLVLPWHLFGRTFRDEQKVCATARELKKQHTMANGGRMSAPYPCKQGQPPAMSTHYFQNKSSGVADCGRIDIIYSFANPMKGGGRPDRKICHTHIIVDGANKSNNFEMSMSFRLSVSDFSWR